MKKHDDSSSEVSDEDASSVRGSVSDIDVKDAKRKSSLAGKKKGGSIDINDENFSSAFLRKL